MWVGLSRAEQNAGGGRHAGAEQQRFVGALEFGDQILGLLH